MKRTLLLLFVLLFAQPMFTSAQETIAHTWNEVLIDAIRADFARPTVHARNLFHSSVLMYDAWAVYDDQASTYFLGNTLGGFEVPFAGVAMPEDIDAAREEAISYATYRLLTHRFQFSPGADEILESLDETMMDLGYDTEFTDTDYEMGPPAALGNYLAEMMIAFGLQDGSNEGSDYTNSYYLPVNDPLDMTGPGNPNIDDPNRWQPLEVPEFIDQGGNPFTDTPPFLSPEWGNVVPFALADSVMTQYERDGFNYNVYHDQGPPPFIDTLGTREGDEFYRWGFSMVTVWQSHHDPNDETLWDISPASIGNVESLPTSFDQYETFYNFFDGGDAGEGHDINPATGEPYIPQFVKRADYSRILAEFWADGPDSETPPGHWFTILNYVNSHPMLEKRWRGQGPELDDLEWDVKTYFTLGGAMHDAAVTAWSVKGWYDYIRPVAALRFMADRGQNTDPDLPSFNPAGIPLIDGLIELVSEDDPLAGLGGINVGKIKFYTWRGPDFIPEPETDYAGVGWILAENWWPYQRPTFVTPPFAGYVSGHSTFSRAAAEVLTFMTGDPFFPGGIGEFQCEQNEFLVFEEGPSEDVTLQWATYRDASDQCSLSRIWGGIHPPADDVPGRLMGIEIGLHSFIHANEFIEAGLPRVAAVTPSTNVVNTLMDGMQMTIDIMFDQDMDQMGVPTIEFSDENASSVLTPSSGIWLDNMTYSGIYDISLLAVDLGSIDMTITEAPNAEGELSIPHTEEDVFIIDMIVPALMASSSDQTLINEDFAGNEIEFDFEFSELMDAESLLNLTFDDAEVASVFANAEGEWLTPTIWRASFETVDTDLELDGVAWSIETATDLAGNPIEATSDVTEILIDTKAPELSLILPSLNPLTETAVGEATFDLLFVFDEAIDTETDLTFTLEGGQINQTVSSVDESWQNPFNFLATFDVELFDPVTTTVDINVLGPTDLVGNPLVLLTVEDAFDVDFTVIGIDESSLAESSVFPIPTVIGQDLQVQFRASENITYELYSTTGQLLTSGQTNGTMLRIPTDSYAAGQYILHLKNGTQALTKTVVFVKEK